MSFDGGVMRSVLYKTRSFNKFRNRSDDINGGDLCHPRMKQIQQLPPSTREMAGDRSTTIDADADPMPNTAQAGTATHQELQLGRCYLIAAGHRL